MLTVCTRTEGALRPVGKHGGGALPDAGEPARVPSVAVQDSECTQPAEAVSVLRGVCRPCRLCTLWGVEREWRA